MSKTGSRGFTLVEVMVALVVVAIALPALLAAVYRQADGTAYLRDKTIAQWVAVNALEEMRIRGRRPSGSGGQRAGVVTMADRDWHWWLESSGTEVPNFYRLEVRVARSEAERDSPLYTLVGFVSGGGGVGQRVGQGVGQ